MHPLISLDHMPRVFRHAFSHARRNTSETTAIHQNANSDRQSLPFFSCYKLIFTSFHDCVINLKCSRVAWNFNLWIYLFIGRGQMHETLFHENVQSRCHACRILAMAGLQLLSLVGPQFSQLHYFEFKMLQPLETFNKINIRNKM